MRSALAFVSSAAAALAIAMTPALAASTAKYQRGYVHAEPYRPIHRNFGDPSFGNRAAFNYAKSTGRCVVDLGYGRFEYCGW